MLTGHDVDLCVIGSGPAGALVANACAARGIRTLLVESGPRLDRAHRAELQRRFVLLEEDPWPRDAERDAFTNASDFGYDLNVRRVRAVGGTTLSWMGMAPRLRESDFRTGTLFGLGADWPIQYADLEPYYVRAEREMGVSGERYRALEAAWRALREGRGIEDLPETQEIAELRAFLRAPSKRGIARFTTLEHPGDE